MPSRADFRRATCRRHRDQRCCVHRGSRSTAALWSLVWSLSALPFVAAVDIGVVGCEDGRLGDANVDHRSSRRCAKIFLK